MKPYHHVRVKKVNSKRSVYLNDLTKEQLEERLLAPWRDRRKFAIDGVIFNNPDDAEEVQVTWTNEPLCVVSEQYDRELEASNIIDAATDRRSIPIRRGFEVTTELLFSDSKANEKLVSSPSSDRITKNKIFIVHGHDEAMKQATARLIERLRLDAVILHEQPNMGRTIIEKFEHNTVDACFAVVLLSSDDELKDGARQARQNVILELGYFIGLLGRHNVAVLHQADAGFQMPSDILGVIYISYEGDWRLKLAKELKAAGCDIDVNLL